MPVIYKSALQADLGAQGLPLHSRKLVGKLVLGTGSSGQVSRPGVGRAHSGPPPEGPGAPRYSLGSLSASFVS